jgi:hypothetical protein
MLEEEVHRDLIEDHQIGKADDLLKALEEIARQSRSVKLWVYVLLKPVLMMTYIRAEHECDWYSPPATFWKIFPYYFVARHVNYARHGFVLHTVRGETSSAW